MWRCVYTVPRVCEGLLGEVTGPSVYGAVKSHTAAWPLALRCWHLDYFLEFSSYDQQEKKDFLVFNV